MNLVALSTFWLNRKCNLNLLADITPNMLSTLVQSGSLELSSSQTRLCVPIINRIYNKLLKGEDCGSIKVDNEVIIDGHHRYVASILAAAEIKTVPSNSTIATYVTPWNTVIFEFDEDWDFTETSSKIDSNFIDSTGSIEFT